MNVTELMSAPWFVKGWIAAGGYLLLLASSGPVVSVVLENIGGERKTGTRKTRSSTLPERRAKVTTSRIPGTNESANASGTLGRWSGSARTCLC